jgi:hypothetical protein
MVENLLNINNHEVQWQVNLIVQIIVQMRLVRFRNDWHNHPSCRVLILGMAKPITSIYQVSSLATFFDSEMHLFKI